MSERWHLVMVKCAQCGGCCLGSSRTSVPYQPCDLRLDLNFFMPNFLIDEMGTGSGWGLNEFLDVKVQDCTWPIVFAVLLLLCPLHFIMNDLEHTEKANKLYSKPPYNYHQWFHQEHFTVCVLSHLYASMSLSQWILILMHFRVMAIVYMSLYFLKQLSTVSLNSMCIKLVLSFPLTSWVLRARWNSSGRGGGGEAGSSWPWK